ncbi:hypothetical protein NMG60_11029331 [Bertholletia excelsa]
MDWLANIRGKEQENQWMENKQVHPIWGPTTGFEYGEIFPLSGKPFFNVVLQRSNLGPYYQLVLPAKIHPVLPFATVPAVLTYRGRNWETLYHGDFPLKRFHTSWKTFAMDNHLRVGDACVFEVMECSRININFRVQILRGDFPAELLPRLSGATPHSPLVLE